MRDRLIELLKAAKMQRGMYSPEGYLMGATFNIPLVGEKYVGLLADHLLAEGVIIPPCKVGDIVYTINRRHPKKWKVHFIGYNSQGEFKMHIATEKFTEMLEVWDYAIGKTVFLTRVEAEKALERSENGKS